MSKTAKIISCFIEFAILRIDNQGNIDEIIINTNPDFNITKGQNIYTLFVKEEKFRLKRVLESGFDIKKKYMELYKKKGEREFVDVKLNDCHGKRFLYIQFFESNREREIMYDRYIEKIVNISERDPLTRVLNRQGFNEKIRRLISNSDKDKKLGIIYLDIDKLKQINDKYGHKIGDKAITNVVNILTANLRERDIIARMGGDEFVIVVEEISGSTSTAYGLAKRLLKAVSKVKGEKYSTTLSIGVHIFKAGKFLKDAENEEKFFKKWEKEINECDKAAYASKEAGRNRVSVSPDFSKNYKL